MIAEFAWWSVWFQLVMSFADYMIRVHALTGANLTPLRKRGRWQLIYLLKMNKGLIAFYLLMQDKSENLNSVKTSKLKENMFKIGDLC